MFKLSPTLLPPPPPLLLFFPFLVPSSLFPLLIPNIALFFFLLLIPQALHSDCVIKHKLDQIKNSNNSVIDILVIWLALITFGPAGPPRHRGVLEVPQSAHVFFGLLLSDETAALGFESSPSDTWKLKMNKTRLISDLKF